LQPCPGDFVIDGDPAPYPKRVGAPQFSVHVYCGQTAAWIKMPLFWYGCSPRHTQHCVRCGPSYPRKKEHPSYPIFGGCLLWPNGSMDEDAAWYGSRPRPRPHCIRRSPSSREKGTAAPPLFSAHVYCGHGRPSQLLLSSCILNGATVWSQYTNVTLKTGQTAGQDRQTDRTDSIA